MIIVQQAVAQVRDRKEKDYAEGEIVACIHQPENPNHENHDFVAWILGWQGAWKCQRSCWWNLVRNWSRKSWDEGSPKEGQEGEEVAVYNP